MDKSNSIQKIDDYNLDHFYNHLQQSGLVPRKQGFGVAPTVRGDKNVLGDEARRNGLPHIVSGISLSDIYGQGKK